MDPHLTRRAFRDGKRGILAELGAAVDRSPKGSVDAPIAAWVAEFNRRGSYVTTSSCSGRVALYAHAPSEEDALAVPHVAEGAVPELAEGLPPPPASATSLPRSSKGSGHWLLVSHGPTLPRGAELSAALAAAPPGCTEAAVKVEPFILHVLCEDVEAARALLSLAVGCGYRESGIGIGSSGRVIVAVRSTAHMLDVPVLAGGRVIADAAYLDGLASVVAQRFRAIEARREGFMARALAAFPPAPTPPVSQPPPQQQQQQQSVCVTCTECGGAFASRNALFNHLAMRPSGGTRYCPVAAAAGAAAAPAAKPPAVESAAMPLDAPALSGIETASPPPPPHRCNACLATFPSRNKLFAHVQSAHATAGAASEAGLADDPVVRPRPPSQVATAVSSVTPRTLPAIAPTIDPRAVDVAAASAARAASLRLMRSVSERWARTTPAPAPRSALQWRQEPPATPASPRCWGHSAVLLQEAPSSGSGAIPGHGIVAVFGGFLLREGGQQHGRSSETRVLDTRSRAWRRCREGPAGGSVPAPRVRHAAVAVPLQGGREGVPGALTEALLIHGGRAGPAHPLDDCWLGRVAAPPLGKLLEPEVEAQVRWGPLSSLGPGPSARWGHSLHLLPAGLEPAACPGSAAGSAASAVAPERSSGPAVLLFGGRDASGCRADVWIGRLRLTNDEDGMPGGNVTWEPLACAGSGPGPRCYHGAALLTPRGAERPTHLLVHGGMGDAGAGPDDEAGTPLFGHGRLLGADSLHLLDLNSLVWVLVAPRVPASLQARMSHCVVSLPSSAADDDGSCRVLILGGSVHDPERPDAELVSVSLGALTCTSETLGETHCAAESVTDAAPPLPLRAAAVIVPPSSDAAAGTPPRVLVVGGGCVAFAFGSYASSTSEAALPLLRPPPVPRASVLGVTAGAAAPATEGSPEEQELVVPASDAQWVRVAVTERGWFDASRHCRPDATSGEKRIRVPIMQSAVAALRAFATSGITSPSLEARLTALLSSGAAEITEGGGNVGGGAAAAGASQRTVGDRRGGSNAIARAASDLRALLAANPSLVSAEAADRLTTPGAPGGLPRHAEWVGDILVLPRDSMTDPVWPQLVAGGAACVPQQSTLAKGLRLISAPVWDCIAAALGSERVARAAAIDPGVTRRSRLTLLRHYVLDDCGGDAASSTTSASGDSNLHAGLVILRDTLPPLPATTERGGDPPIAPATGPLPPVSPDSVRRLARAVAALRGVSPASPGGWTLVRDAGVSYVLDVSRLMLSSGNITEKLRVGALPAAGEIVVDMFAGIGYWTLPLLVRAGVAHVHACDWNPDAIACLCLGLVANRVPVDRVTLWPGDNAQLQGRCVEADRVVLGLIPTSQGAWATAVSLLRPAAGGWLHVHMNQPDEGVAAFAAELEAALAALAEGMGRCGWAFVVRHIERVKSYAPRIWHCVYDVEARPPTAGSGQRPVLP